MTPVVPRPSSTVCVFRPGPDGSEIMMVQRAKSARFMGGAWVFPGGAIDEIDSSDLARRAVRGAETEMGPWLAAALRELAEETSMWITDPPLPGSSLPGSSLPGSLSDEAVFAAVLDRGARFDGDRLVYFANWITPAALPVRFDTRFFAVEVQGDVFAEADGREIDDLEWITVDEALTRESDDWTVPFPTRKVLEFLSGFSGVPELAEHVATLDGIEPVQPRLSTRPGSVRAVMPGEPGFADIDESAGIDEETRAEILEAGAAMGETIRREGK